MRKRALAWLHGWNRRGDAYELALNEEDVKELLSHPAMSVPISERSDIEEKATLAMGLDGADLRHR